MKVRGRIIIWATLFLAILWGTVSYYVANAHYEARISEIISRGSQDAQGDADDIADSIRRNLHYFSGVPSFFVHGLRIIREVSRSGASASPSTLPYEVRKKRWSADPGLNDLSRAMAMAQASFGADLIYILNAAGDCIAAGNWDKPGSPIGTNFAERDFFRQNKSGQHGLQYAVGKTTHIAGLYFSSPVIIHGKFMGSVVAKANVPSLSFLTRLTNDFVTDKNGVIILASDRSMEMKVLPDAPFFTQSRQSIINYYQRSDFQTLQVEPWGKGKFAAVQRINAGNVPYVVATRELPEYGLTVHAEHELPEMLVLEREYARITLWICFGGSLFIVIGGIASYFLQNVRWARQQLRKTEGRLGNILQVSMDAIISVNARQDIVYFNKAAERAFGYAASQVIGQPLDRLIPPRFHATHKQHVESFGKTGATGRSMGQLGTVFGLRANGEEFPVEASIAQSAVDREIYYTVILRDISERKQVEDKLLESENKFRMLFESANDGLLLLSMDGRILDINAICHERLGYTKDEMMGRRISEFDSPEYAPRVPERMAEIMNKGVATFESAHLRRDGTAMHIEINARKVNLHGQAMVLSVIRNISERRKIEEVVRRSEAQYRAVIETSVDGFWVVGEQGQLLEVNTAYEQKSGYSREELLAMRIPDLEANESPEETAAHLEKLMRDGHDRFESQHRRKDGSIWPVEVAVTFWREGGLSFVFLVDITERKQAASKLELLNFAINKGSMSMFWISPEGRVVDVNERGCKELGYSYEELVGMFLWDFNPGYKPEDRPAAWAALKEQKTRTFEFRQQRKDGTIFPVEVVSNYISFEGREFAISFVQDITWRKQAEERAVLAATIYEATAEAVVVTDEDNFIVDVNPAFTTITGYKPEEVLGRNPRIMQSGRHSKDFYRIMWLAIRNEGHWQGEIWDRRKDGELYAKWATISVIRHADGSVYRHVAQFSDITERKQKDDLIQRQASYDMLTGLPNRRLFQDRLEQEIKKADTNRAGSPLVLLYIDLDRFKEINDTLGHAKGDILLVEAARRISKCVRETDTVSRLGGDEFTVILPEMGDKQQLERITQSIIGELIEMFDLGDGHTGYISASIGIALYPNDARDVEELVKHGDQAMYAAKAQGRNGFSYFTASMQEGAREKLALTNDLRHALAHNELHVYYQPIVDLANGKIFKAEALLRWKHPERGMVSPAAFIPLAEETGLIREIGAWVFDEAIDNIVRWREQTGSIVSISVNKSPVQFDDGQERDHVWADRLEAVGLPGRCITVEITEGLLVKSSDAVKERLLEFRNRGIEVSLDDFGTGFSSLSYLKQFDVDYLKIDRSFISNLIEDASDRALTEAIIVMAHKLGIKTIAEGVETNAQRELLISFGCDYAQGFLYSPAVPADEFEKMLGNE